MYEVIMYTFIFLNQIKLYFDPYILITLCIIFSLVIKHQTELFDTLQLPPLEF